MSIWMALFLHRRYLHRQYQYPPHQFRYSLASVCSLEFASVYYVVWIRHCCHFLLQSRHRHHHHPPLPTLLGRFHHNPHQWIHHPIYVFVLLQIPWHHLYSAVTVSVTAYHLHLLLLFPYHHYLSHHHHHWNSPHHHHYHSHYSPTTPYHHLPTPHPVPHVPFSYPVGLLVTCAVWFVESRIDGGGVCRLELFRIEFLLRRRRIESCHILFLCMFVVYFFWI
mmetsp:Transcript_7421/g.15206  ORF Transcript_7421/g.15206 Transcript_7421/m.15206 type:complete len:222 (-) Transcript_7421:674-1339(-)